VVASAPFQETLRQLDTFGATVSGKLIGDPAGNSTSDIVGQPVGRSGLLADLDAQFVAYSPEELIKIADKEYAWCESEMIKASKALGYKEDWKAALEHVKNLYVEPGQQTRLVHDLSAEAVASFLPWRRGSYRVLPYRFDVAFRQADVYAWKQSTYVAEHSLSRANTWTSSSNAYDCPIQILQEPFHHTLLD
jgi:hypothetical protein